MKTLIRVLGILLAVITLGLVAVAVYVARTWDRVYEVPLVDVQVSTDPEVLGRGQYLVYGPAHCVRCHAGSWEAARTLADGPTGDPTFHRAN